MGSEKEPKDESETPAFHGFEGMLQDLTPGAAKAKAKAESFEPEPPTLKKPPISKPTPQVVLPKVAPPPAKATSSAVTPLAKLPPPPVKLSPPARTARLSPTPAEAEVAGQEEPEPPSAVPESSLTVDPSEVELLDSVPAPKAEPARASGERFPTLKALEEEKPKDGGHTSLVIVALGLALAAAIAWTLTRPPRPTTEVASATSAPVASVSAQAPPSASAQASAAPSASAAATALPSATASTAPSASASAAPTSTAVAALPTSRPTNAATATHAPVATTPPPPTVTTPPPPPPTQPPPPPPPTSTGNPLLNAP